VKTISLPCGRVTLVSDVDYELLRQYRWRVHEHNASGQPYVRTLVDGKQVLMHRMIVGPPETMKVDHIDNDTLNNQRGNLRVASYYDNNINRRFWASTGFKGVTKDGARFRARITVNRVETLIGRFATAEEAARAYDAAAFEQWGEFAYLNFREAFSVRPSDETEMPF
jgi:hypothetical protein